MGGFVRSLLALLLMSAGVIAALGGVFAQWLDTTAHTPEPSRPIPGFWGPSWPKSPLPSSNSSLPRWMAFQVYGTRSRPS